MARSIKKGFFVDPHLMDKIEVATKANARRPITTWRSRSDLRVLCRVTFIALPPFGLLEREEW